MSTRVSLKTIQESVKRPWVVQSVVRDRNIYSRATTWTVVVWGPPDYPRVTIDAYDPCPLLAALTAVDPR